MIAARRVMMRSVRARYVSVSLGVACMVMASQPTTLATGAVAPSTVRSGISSWCVSVLASCGTAWYAPVWHVTVGRGMAWIF
jgi:hypothetical protein